jgi:hypothetical protein
MTDWYCLGVKALLLYYGASFRITSREKRKLGKRYYVDHDIKPNYSKL